MSFKTLMDEARSRNPNKELIDGLITWGRTGLLALFLTIWGFLTQAARKYIPSISLYLTPNLPLVVCAILVAFAILVFLIGLTTWGRKNRLLQVLRLLRRYKRFNHEKEMEVVSRIHSRNLAAALVFLMSLLLFSPLAIAFNYMFGVALISDITNNIKGTHFQPSFGPKLVFNAYGIALGGAFSWIYCLLASARLESLMLSDKYRRKMINRWQASRLKIKARLPKRPRILALTKSASAGS